MILVINYFNKWSNTAAKRSPLQKCAQYKTVFCVTVLNVSKWMWLTVLSRGKSEDYINIRSYDVKLLKGSTSNLLFGHFLSNETSEHSGQRTVPVTWHMYETPRPLLPSGTSDELRLKKEHITHFKMTFKWTVLAVLLASSSTGILNTTSSVLQRATVMRFCTWPEYSHFKLSDTYV